MWVRLPYLAFPFNNKPMDPKLEQINRANEQHIEQFFGKTIPKCIDCKNTNCHICHKYTNLGWYCIECRDTYFGEGLIYNG